MGHSEELLLFCPAVTQPTPANAGELPFLGEGWLGFTLPGVTSLLCPELWSAQTASRPSCRLPIHSAFCQLRKWKRRKKRRQGRGKEPESERKTSQRKAGKMRWESNVVHSCLVLISLFLTVCSFILSVVVNHEVLPQNWVEQEKNNAGKEMCTSNQ